MAMLPTLAGPPHGGLTFFAEPMNTTVLIIRLDDIRNDLNLQYFILKYWFPVSEVVSEVVRGF